MDHLYILPEIMLDLEREPSLPVVDSPCRIVDLALPYPKVIQTM